MPDLNFLAAGPDRKPTQEPVAATIITAKPQGKLVKITAKTDAPAALWNSGDLVRLWVE